MSSRHFSSYFFCMWGTHKIRLKFALSPLHSITIPHCLTFLAPAMKLEFLRAAVYQQNHFHSIKTPLSCPCFCSFFSPYLEPFAVYPSLYQKPSLHLPFLLGSILTRECLWWHFHLDGGTGGRGWSWATCISTGYINFQLCCWFPEWSWPKALSLLVPRLSVWTAQINPVSCFCILISVFGGRLNML